MCLLVFKTSVGLKEEVPGGFDSHMSPPKKEKAKMIGKTVDFKREIDCLFLLQKFKYRQLSNTVVAFLIGGILE